MARKTVGYTRPVGNPNVRASRGRNPGSSRRAAWLGAPRTEAVRPPDVTDPRRAITRLERRNRDTQHNNDMYRIGGGAVGPVKSGYESAARVKPHISWVKGPNGKIVAESKAQTFQRSNVPWRPELPVGKPGDAPRAAYRGARGRMVSNPGYGAWKNSAMDYNASLSRQQTLQPTNTVLGGIKPVETSPTAKFPAPVSVRYRSGREQKVIKPQADTSPFRQTL